MQFAIRAVGGTQTYWLERIGQTTQYRWRRGAVGQNAATRFSTRQDAEQFLVRHRVGGAGGGYPEIVEMGEAR